MARKVIILGAGPAAREVSYLLSYDQSIEVVGHTDRNVSLIGTQVRGNPVLGTDDLLADYYASGIRHVIIGVGAPESRNRLRKLALGLGFELVNAIHPSAVVSPDVRLGSGVVVGAGAVVSDNPVIHDNTWIGLSALVSHDCTVKEDSLVGFAVALGAHVITGERALIGGGSVIGLGLSIGDDAIVGSGANVVHDVPSRAVVVGNPARVIRFRDPE